MSRDPKFAIPARDALSPDCAIGEREHAGHTLGSPGGNKPGAWCGGQRPACNECNRDVPEDDAGPSCGAHVLHIECAPWFGCHECYQIRSEIP